MTKSADPRLTRVKPVKESFNVDQRPDTPLLHPNGIQNKYNPQIGVKLSGVKNADAIRINKSDYTPSVGREKN
jgi:hypothetical protein